MSFELTSYLSVWIALLVVLILMVGVVNLLRRHTTKLREWRVRGAVLAAATGLALLVVGYDHGLGWFRTRALRSAINESTRLVIRTGYVDHDPSERDIIAYESSDRQILCTLAESLTLRRAGTARCMCGGDMTFDFYRGAKLRCSFSLQHQQALRIRDAGRDDWPLTVGSKTALARWLATHGIPNRVKLAKEEEWRRLDAVIDEWNRSRGQTNYGSSVLPIR